MKTIFTLLLATMISITVNAQFTENFENDLNSLTGNCWNMTQVNHSSDGQVAPISGNGSLYTNPPTNGSSTRDIKTPYLNISSTSLTIGFQYKLSSAINGNATRTIEIGLENNSGVFTSLFVITLDRNSPSSVQNFNQNFTLPSTGVRRLLVKIGGATGDGNTRVILDDLYVSANAVYGPSVFCNSAPAAVNDAFSAVNGTVITGNVMSNDNEPNGEVMTAAVVATSSEGTLVLNTNGSFTFTPNEGFVSATTTFTYQLTDQGFDPAVSNTATVTITYFALSPLPVKLMNFDARYTKPNVVLNWSTAQEKNFSHFILERSSDGTNFSQVALVFGAGESDSQKNYTYTDNTLAGIGGLVYYRLRSVDQDGKTEYSSVRIIRIMSDNKEIRLAAYPNPVINELRITIPATWQNKAVTYQVFSVSGQMVSSKMAASSSQTETVQMNNIAPGLYIVKAICGAETALERIIKQ